MTASARIAAHRASRADTIALRRQARLASGPEARERARLALLELATIEIRVRRGKADLSEEQPARERAAQAVIEAGFLASADFAAVTVRTNMYLGIRELLAMAARHVLVAVCRNCGNVIDGADWADLPIVGLQDAGNGRRLELRNCICGSTLSKPYPFDVPAYVAMEPR